MAQPPERYEPGELDRTRKNLGQVSHEEAKLMAKKLGGEVGVEKTDSNIEQKYGKLKFSSPKNAAAPPAESRARRSAYVNPSAPKVFGSVRTVKKEWPRMKYWDRLKIDFYCSRPEVKVKTLSQALSAILGFTGEVADTISRGFIMDGDHLFAKDVENLVLAVRGLTSKNYKNAIQSIRRLPLYNDILKTLRSWDIEGLHQELGRLQARPGGRSFAEFVPLLKVLLRPFFLLSKLNLQLHLQPAVQKMFELARNYLVKQDDKERLLRYYLIAREVLPLVFGRLRLQMYPFLLKLLSPRYLDPDEFFAEKEDKILDFLEIKENELIKEAPASAVVIPPTDTSQDAGPSRSPSEEVRTPIPKSALKGLELLDRLFPRAGWNNLETNPDFYSYFQSVFDFPRGSEVLSVKDPLQIVLPISIILQNLFFGFQEVKFGLANNQLGQTIDLQGEIDKAVSQWHFFMEEVVAKNYLTQLQEYCRQVERSGRQSAESKRIEHKLLWIKKNYLLPHLMVPVFEDIRPQSLGYPSLAVQVKTLIGILAPIAVEVEQALLNQKPSSPTVLKTVSMANPLASLRFPVENMVSKRLSQVLSPDARNNRSLLFYTFTILLTLDHLLNQPSSVLYGRDERLPPYRTSEGERDESPLYNIPKKNTATLLKKLSETAPAVTEDEPVELYGPFIVQEAAKKCLQAFHKERTPFCLASFQVMGLEEQTRIHRDRKHLELQDLLKRIGRPAHIQGSQEDGSIFVVLPDTESPTAASWSRQVVTAAAELQPGPLALLGLVVPFQKNWTVEKLLAQPSRGYQIGRDYPPQVLGVYQPETQSFEFMDDLAVIPMAEASFESEDLLSWEDDEDADGPVR